VLNFLAFLFVLENDERSVLFAAVFFAVVYGLALIFLFSADFIVDLISTAFLGADWDLIFDLDLSFDASILAFSASCSNFCLI
jgi:hypothetical protein